MYLIYKFWDDLLKFKDNNVVYLFWVIFLLLDLIN